MATRAERIAEIDAELAIVRQKRSELLQLGLSRKTVSSVDLTYLNPKDYDEQENRLLRERAQLVAGGTRNLIAFRRPRA